MSRQRKGDVVWRGVGCALNNDSGKRIANVLSGGEALARAVERPARLQRRGGAG